MLEHLSSLVFVPVKIDEVLDVILALGIEGNFRKLSVVFILLIVGFVLAAKRDLILDHGWILLVATLLLHLGGFLGGYGGAYLMGRDRIERQTLSIEVGMQNSGLGTALAAKHFPQMTMTPAPCALSAIIHCLVGSVLAWWWSSRKD